MYKPDELTAGERFTLWLRRCDMTAEEAARLHQVAPSTILNWKANRGHVPLSPLDRITPREGIFIARRRLGLNTDEFAKMLGCSATTLTRAETSKSKLGHTAVQAALKYFTAKGWPNVELSSPAL